MRACLPRPEGRRANTVLIPDKYILRRGFPGGWYLYVRRAKPRRWWHLVQVYETVYLHRAENLSEVESFVKSQTISDKVIIYR